MIDREHELALIVAWLRRRMTRLLTLTGPGGVGKTRLARAASAALADAFVDGVEMVDLAPLDDPAQLLPYVADAVGLRDHGAPPLARRLIQHLSRRNTLLVLDTFEHLLDGGRTIVGLLAACPSLSVLVTSRAPLSVRSERQLVVPPLDLPDSAGGRSLEALAAVPSVALFVARAQAAEASFGLDAENAEAVAEICARMQGVPLAIELAAAATRTLPIPVLRAHLASSGGGLAVLGRGPRDAPERHRSIAAAIGWSYRLLEPPEQRLLGRLSVIVGGFDLAAAVAVAADDRAEELGARGEVQREHHAADAVHQAVARGVVGFGAVDAAREDVIGDFAEERFGGGTLGAGG
jgi:predicted ATPase